MNNCTKCGKNLSGAIKSKVKEDGSFYLACAGCGNVVYVTKNALGLTEIHNTGEGTSKQVMKQMVEAKELFEAAGHNIMSYIDTMNGEKKSATKLRSVDYTAVKSTVKASIDEVVSSVAKSVGVDGATLTITNSNKIADIIVEAIKKADK